MQYSVEAVTQLSKQEMLDFLKEHENYALFLLGNFENYGAILTENPYSGNFKLIREARYLGNRCREVNPSFF